MWYSSDITWCHTKCYISRNLPQMNGTWIRYSCVVVREASVENVQKFTNCKRCRKQFKCESLHREHIHTHARTHACTQTPAHTITVSYSLTHTHTQTHLVYYVSEFRMMEGKKNKWFWFHSWWWKCVLAPTANTSTNAINTMVVWFNRLKGMFHIFPSLPSFFLFLLLLNAEYFTYVFALYY